MLTLSLQRWTLYHAICGISLNLPFEPVPFRMILCELAPSLGLLDNTIFNLLKQIYTRSQLTISILDITSYEIFFSCSSCNLTVYI